VDRSNYQFILNGEVFDYVSSYQYFRFGAEWVFRLSVYGKSCS
jgi:hypothetical protein